jgi:hypothetical protein
LANKNPKFHLEEASSKNYIQNQTRSDKKSAILKNLNTKQSLITLSRKSLHQDIIDHRIK